MLCGIPPESWFIEKSIDSNDLIAPILSGICPVKELCEKFSDYNALRFVTSKGIFPEKLFLEISISLTKSRIFPESTTFPLVTTDSRSTKVTSVSGGRGRYCATFRMKEFTVTIAVRLPIHFGTDPERLLSARSKICKNSRSHNLVVIEVQVFVFSKRES